MLQFELTDKFITFLFRVNKMLQIRYFLQNICLNAHAQIKIVVLYHLGFYAKRQYFYFCDNIFDKLLENVFLSGGYLSVRQ